MPAMPWRLARCCTLALTWLLHQEHAISVGFRPAGVPLRAPQGRKRGGGWVRSTRNVGVPRNTVSVGEMLSA